MRSPILFFLLMALTTSFGQDDKVSIPKELRLQMEYSDSIYSPLNKTKSCYIYCKESDSLKMVIADGYIAKNVDFDRNYDIDSKRPLPYHPKEGNKIVLFLHFQPDPIGEMTDCPSSNLTVFLDLGELEKQSVKNISKNIQLALNTGGPFDRFKTKRKINGTIEIVSVEDNIAHIILSLNFDLEEENMTGVMLETYIRIIEQSHINKNFG